MTVPLPPYEGLTARNGWWVRNLASAGGTFNIDSYRQDGPWWNFPRNPSGTWFAIELYCPEPIASFELWAESYIQPTNTYIETYFTSGYGEYAGQWRLGTYSTYVYCEPIIDEVFYLVLGFDEFPWSALVRQDDTVVVAAVNDEAASAFPLQDAYAYQWVSGTGEDVGADGVGFFVGAFFDATGLIWQPTEDAVLTDYWADWGADPHIFDLYRMTTPSPAEPERILPSKVRHIWLADMDSNRVILRNAQ